MAIETVRLFLHILAATIWVGGQLTLAGLVPVLRAIGGDAPKLVARQFRRIAWPAFAVLIVTGGWNVAEQEAEGEGGGGLLMAKMTVVLISGVTAYLHERASTKRANAIWGALTGLSALTALLLGVLLSQE